MVPERNNSVHQHATDPPLKKHLGAIRRYIWGQAGSLSLPGRVPHVVTSDTAPTGRDLADLIGRALSRVRDCDTPNQSQTTGRN